MLWDIVILTKYLMNLQLWGIVIMVKNLSKSENVRYILIFGEPNKQINQVDQINSINLFKSVQSIKLDCGSASTSSNRFLSCFFYGSFCPAVKHYNIFLCGAGLRAIFDDLAKLWLKFVPPIFSDRSVQIFLIVFWKYLQNCLVCSLQNKRIDKVL